MKTEVLKPILSAAYESYAQKGAKTPGGVAIHNPNQLFEEFAEKFLNVVVKKVAEIAEQPQYSHVPAVSIYTILEELKDHFGASHGS